MGSGEDVTAAGGGDKDLALRSSLLHSGNFEASHSCLEGIDRIDFGHKNASTHVVESVSAALANVTEAGDDADLAGNHDVGSTLDAINERLLAAVQVVELGLGDGVVDVDRGNAEFLVLHHPVEVVDTGGGLLRHAVAVVEHLRVFLVDQRSQVTTIIENKVELLPILEGDQLLLNAPFVLLFGLALPGETAKAPVVSKEIAWHNEADRRLFSTYTGTPPAAMAAAAWSWVEKMLQLDQVTSAPRAVRVSMRTAVWMAAKGN